MKFALLTDTHLVPAGSTLFTVDPAERLRQALRSINRDHSDIAFIIVTGDLAHRGNRRRMSTSAISLRWQTCPSNL